ncbi:hypothetical protein IP69_15445 [Bosea sp. AAP35]|nr:hypothetical protein IP69_15445 [Bosea sp. AAP35]
MPEPGEAANLVLWRAYVPRWSYLPLSGVGAARFGGRWNRMGRPCLYAACELSSAWAEYNQGFVQHPALIAQLEVQRVRLFDLTLPEALEAAGAAPDIHRIAWRAELDAGREPATHIVAENIETAGWDGVIYPSFMSPGGRCVALWRWNAGAGDARVSVIDPEQRLPTSPASWHEP